MTEGDAKRGLIWHGLILFFLGLLTGFDPNSRRGSFRSNRMAASVDDAEEVRKLRNGI